MVDASGINTGGVQSVEPVFGFGSENWALLPTFTLAVFAHDNEFLIIWQ